MYVATVLGCREYLGFDASPNAISSAHAIPVPVGLSARFEVADFGRPLANTGCPPRAALAYDSLYLAKDLPTALRSVRALAGERSGLWLTAYVGEGVHEAGVQGRTENEWREALASAGFDIDGVEDVSAEWREFGRRLHNARLAASTAVLRELGTATGSQALWISRRMLGLDGRMSFLGSVRRVEISSRVRR